ncbi:adenine deaminase [Filimonas sp.]|nr:adenine deaminase [Filimonas sp.]
MNTNTLYHNLIDIHSKRTFPAEIQIQDGRILSVKETELPCEHYILPGLIDAHIHIESSMLIPSEFARIAVKHGTVATISDPHEIANVCGVEGVEYMIDNAKKVPFKFHFGAPSCVPATRFETAGDTIDSKKIERLLQRDDIYFLSEMMNYPGVLFEDEEVMKKIAIAQKYNKPVDGHAPGLRGEKARQYIEAGISTDHECFTREEALDKLQYGMKILIREGSAAKNFEALIDLLNDFEHEIMFCCDDKHPDELMLYHINDHVKRAVAKGIDIYKVLRAASLNPVLHYNLSVGLLRKGDAADFIIIDHPDHFNILKTVIDGETVFEEGESKILSIEERVINQFACTEKKQTDFDIIMDEIPVQIRVIEAMEGQLITKTFLTPPKSIGNHLVSDIENDILKIVVVNRYRNAPVAKAFIKNFGLKKGAIASTVAHDSHNIICVGVNDTAICKAVNALIETQGGIVVVNDDEEYVMPLPVGGLMSHAKAEDVASAYSRIDREAKNLAPL